MTGYMIAMGPCLVCRQPFSFNPERVPSMRPTPEATREPICAGCFALINRKRAEHGLPPHTLMPGAYEPTEAG